MIYKYRHMDDNRITLSIEAQTRDEAEQAIGDAGLYESYDVWEEVTQ